MDYLPLDIILEIKKYLPIETIYTTNKTNFLKYYPSIISKYTIKHKLFKRYILNILRKDCIFQFKIILRLNLNTWPYIKNWRYDNKVYSNYIDFIRDYCINIESGKCGELIKNYSYFSSLNKKTPKRIGSKNIKWSN